MIALAIAPPDPYAHLSLRDRLEVLVFEARFAGLPESLISATWEAANLLDDEGTGKRQSMHLGHHVEQPCCL